MFFAHKCQELKLNRRLSNVFIPQLYMWDWNVALMDISPSHSQLGHQAGVSAIGWSIGSRQLLLLLERKTTTNTTTNGQMNGPKGIRNDISASAHTICIIDADSRTLSSSTFVVVAHFLCSMMISGQLQPTRNTKNMETKKKLNSLQKPSGKDGEL